MSCSCHKKDGNPTELTSPDEQCLACCEKHFSQAWDWACEGGYIAVNRQKIIGALASAQAHCWRGEYALAEKLRDLRHLIQDREEEKITNQWENLACDIDLRLRRQTLGRKAMHTQEAGRRN